MSFLKHHWFGTVVSLFVLFFVTVFLLVLFSPRQDLQKRGFIPCTENMVSEMLSCRENKAFCMLGSVIKNSWCDSKVVLNGLGAWVKGQQSTPWENYLFEPELKETEQDEGLQEFYDENPDVSASMEELRRQNIELEKQISETEELKEEDKDKFLIEIDPGISFGTGKHETTQLCIRQLQKYVEGKHPKVLDVGCGSGILSIVALKLGAREVVGTDLDADCMTSTRDNMQVNHLDLSLGTFYVGNLIDDEELQEKVGTEEYEIVVANILAPVIIAMAPVIPARLKQGGYFITSGIIDFKENEVKEAIEAAGLTVVEINHQGEWVNITAQKQ